METKLTEKEELFCQGIIKGLGTVGAYKSAYSTDCNDSTAMVAASKILKKDKVSKRLADLRRPLEEAITAENATARNEQIAFIKERIEICKSNGDEGSIIRYTDMLNRIYGVYKETIEEGKKEGKLAQMDTGTLKKLTTALTEKAV